MTPDEAFALGLGFAELRSELAETKAERDLLRERLANSTRVSLAKSDEITRLTGYLAAATEANRQGHAAITHTKEHTKEHLDFLDGQICSLEGEHPIVGATFRGTLDRLCEALDLPAKEGE